MSCWLVMLSDLLNPGENRMRRTKGRVVSKVTRKAAKIDSSSAVNCNSWWLFSFLLFLSILRLAPLDFLSSFDGFYDCTNQGGDTWFGQLIDSCSRVPVFSHRIPNAPFKLHVTAVWMRHRRNLHKTNNGDLFTQWTHFIQRQYLPGILIPLHGFPLKAHVCNLPKSSGISVGKSTFYYSKHCNTAQI